MDHAPAEITSPLSLEGDTQSQSSPPHESGEDKADTSSQLDWRVWVIFSGLAVSALLSALEGSIISTALPTITADLNSGANYLWVINLYFLTRYWLLLAVTTYGKYLADIFGPVLFFSQYAAN